VGVGVHGHRGDAELPARPHDPHRDLAAVGDEHLLGKVCHSGRILRAVPAGTPTWPIDPARLAGTRFASVVAFDELGSTNTELMERARAGAPEGLVVVADHQTAGRGRLGRTWSAAPGTALLVSVLLRPRL